MRVNARFDELTYRQLEYLMQATGQSVSHVVRESVAQYYVQVKQKKAPSRFLALAGTGNSGRSDISSNIRQFYGEALAQKYPQHTGGAVPPVSTALAAASATVSAAGSAVSPSPALRAQRKLKASPKAPSAVKPKTK